MSRFWIGLLAAVSLSVLSGGCTPPRPKLVVTDPDPSVKIPAIKKAVQDENLSATRQMVKDLESDDPAVRFYAIEGLRKLTGENFGYEWYLQDPDDRAAALKKWHEWLARHEREFANRGDRKGG